MARCGFRQIWEFEGAGSWVGGRRMGLTVVGLVGLFERNEKKKKLHVFGAYLGCY